MNPADTSGIELCLFPERSRFAHYSLFVAICSSAFASFLLGQSWWASSSEPWCWLAIPFVVIGFMVLWRIWRVLECSPIPRSIQFLANGRVLITRSIHSTPIECVPGALVILGRVVAFTFCPCKPLEKIPDIQWLSGMDAIGDEKWRQLCVWLVWQRRARKSL